MWNHPCAPGGPHLMALIVHSCLQFAGISFRMVHICVHRRHWSIVFFSCVILTRLRPRHESGGSASSATFWKSLRRPEMSLVDFTSDDVWSWACALGRSWRTVSLPVRSVCPPSEVSKLGALGRVCVLGRASSAEFQGERWRRTLPAAPCHVALPTADAASDGCHRGLSCVS